MTLWLFLASAVLLAVERVAYVLIWRYPETFRVWSLGVFGRRAGHPVDLVRALFVLFKLVQAGVFAAWIYLHGNALTPAAAGALVVSVGAVCIVLGQLLNLSVFARLGSSGVFYGIRFGQPVPWCRTFPFSVLAHPQYVGTVLSIWGLFLIMRFPYPDWFLLPALETAYYSLGARYER